MNLELLASVLVSLVPRHMCLSAIFIHVLQKQTPKGGLPCLWPDWHYSHGRVGEEGRGAAQGRAGSREGQPPGELPWVITGNFSLNPTRNSAVWATPTSWSLVKSYSFVCRPWGQGHELPGTPSFLFNQARSKWALGLKRKSPTKG